MARIGVMYFTDQLARPSFVALAQRIEMLGLDTLWLPEVFGREVFSSASYLLGRTTMLTVASGIANVYARDALNIRQAAQTLGELSGGRFILGLGVSNEQIVTTRGHGWEAPLAKLTRYLDEMGAGRVYAPAHEAPAPVYLAAHGPRLLELAGRRTDGANTYLMTTEHTRSAREILGPGRTLNAAQYCMLWDRARGSAEAARTLARQAVQRYITLGYYRRMWVKQGFEPHDFENGGSDRLVDTLVAWGPLESIQARIDAHHQAGASEVIVVPLNPAGGGTEPHWPLLEGLAPA